VFDFKGTGANLIRRRIVVAGCWRIGDCVAVCGKTRRNKGHLLLQRLISRRSPRSGRRQAVAATASAAAAEADCCLDNRRCRPMKLLGAPMRILRRLDVCADRRGWYWRVRSVRRCAPMHCRRMFTHVLRITGFSVVGLGTSF
jgi:hypothetical protein